MFQASLAIGVLAVSFGVHGRVQPFVTPAAQQDAFLKAHATYFGEPSSITAKKNTGPSPGRGQRRRNASVAASSGTMMDSISEMIDFNRLETVLLCSSTAVLLCGMIFASAELDVNSPGYTIVTVCVSAVIISSVGMFVWMLAAETKRTCKQRNAMTAMQKTTCMSIYKRLSMFVAGRHAGRVPLTAPSTNPLHAGPPSGPGAPNVSQHGDTCAPSAVWVANPMRSGGDGAPPTARRNIPQGPTNDPVMQQLRLSENAKAPGPDSIALAVAVSVDAARVSEGRVQRAAATARLLPAGPLDLRHVIAATRIQAARRGSVVRKQFFNEIRRVDASGVRGAAAAAAPAAAAAKTSSSTTEPNRLSYVSPSGWRLFVDDDGDEFYYNTHTLASQRKVPGDYQYVSATGWTEYVDEEGDRFFYNVHTKAVTWVRPGDHV